MATQPHEGADHLVDDGTRKDSTSERVISDLNVSVGYEGIALPDAAAIEPALTSVLDLRPQEDYSETRTTQAAIDRQAARVIDDAVRTISKQDHWNPKVSLFGARYTAGYPQLSIRRMVNIEGESRLIFGVRLGADDTVEEELAKRFSLPLAVRSGWIICDMQSPNQQLVIDFDRMHESLSTEGFEDLPSSDEFASTFMRRGQVLVHKEGNIAVLFYLEPGHSYVQNATWVRTKNIVLGTLGWSYPKTEAVGACLAVRISDEQGKYYPTWDPRESLRIQKLTTRIGEAIGAMS